MAFEIFYWYSLKTQSWQKKSCFSQVCPWTFISSPRSSHLLSTHHFSPRRVPLISPCTFFPRHTLTHSLSLHLFWDKRNSLHFGQTCQLQLISLDWYKKFKFYKVAEYAGYFKVKILKIGPPKRYRIAKIQIFQLLKHIHSPIVFHYRFCNPKFVRFNMLPPPPAQDNFT